MITHLARCGRGGGGEGWCGTAFGWCTPPVWSLRCDGWTTAGGAVGRGGVWCGFKCGRHWRWFPVHVERLLRGRPRGKHGRRLTGLTPEETVLLVITWNTEVHVYSDKTNDALIINSVTNSYSCYMVWKESLSDQNAFIQILFYSAYFVLFRKTKINLNISQSVHHSPR